MKKIEEGSQAEEEFVQDVIKPDQLQKDIDKEIKGGSKNRQEEITTLTESIETTKKELREARQELGLPPTEEEPPSIVQDRERIKKLQDEQKGLKEQDEISPEDEPAKKIEHEFTKELGKAFIRLSSQIQELEDSLKLNKLNRIPFNAENIQAVSIEDSVNFQKALEVIGDLQTDLRKDFIPQDDRNKLSIEPINFTRIIDSLNELRGAIINIRGKIDKRPKIENPAEAEELSDDLKKVLYIIRIKMEGLEESRTLLQRYTRK